MEPKALPGTPWEGEISLGNFSGGPPEDNNEFFFGPGGLRERFGRLPGSLLEPSRRPRGPRRPPGAILAPFWEPKWRPNCWSFFGHFGALFWSPSPFALSGLASMLISWPWLPGCFGSAFYLQKWGPQSGLHLSGCLSSSLACSWSFFVFAGFEALILKVRSPRGLKPRVAAGGREAIRISCCPAR